MEEKNKPLDSPQGEALHTEAMQKVPPPQAEALAAESVQKESPPQDETPPDVTPAVAISGASAASAQAALMRFGVIALRNEKGSYNCGSKISQSK